MAARIEPFLVPLRLERTFPFGDAVSLLTAGVDVRAVLAFQVL